MNTSLRNKILPIGFSWESVNGWVKQEDFKKYHDELLTNIDRLEAEAVEVFGRFGHYWDHKQLASDSHRGWLIGVEKITQEGLTKDALVDFLRASAKAFECDDFNHIANQIEMWGVK